MIEMYHQIRFEFKQTKNIDSNELNILNQYKKNLESYIYILWDIFDATVFIKNEYPEYLPFFLSETSFPIIKCDFFRYLLMYHFGGIYTDLDFICLKNINELNDSFDQQTANIFLSEEWYNSVQLTSTLHNGILISKKKKHNFWIFLINDIIKWFDNGNIISNENDVYEITGTKRLCKYTLENINTYDDICILQYHYFCPFIAILNDSLLNNNKDIIVCNGINKVPDMSISTWLFFLSSDHEKIKQLCPQSYFCCVYLNNKSMWKN
jgi:hypothetical protein